MQAPTATKIVSPEGPWTDCFEASYSKSRKRLLTSISRLSDNTPRLIDSRSIAAKGPDGETLATDFILIGARKPRQVLVISSATHGVEGFAGSAIQHDFVDHRLPAIKFAQDTAIILIHANNPYGFAWLRRVNEHNVDINRNFMDQFDKLAVSQDYQTLFDALNPTDLDPQLESKRWAALEKFERTNGRTRTQKAITEGQYAHPEGIQFGGQKREPCVQNLLDLTGEHLACADQILWIDIHTGLGESGECELISGMPPDSSSFQYARTVWPAIVSSVSGESLSAPLKGIMDAGLHRQIPPGSKFAMVFPEFGTHPVERVIRAMRSDNWLHQHGPEDVLQDPAARAIKAELLETFRPDSPQWRETVQRTGRKIIEQAIAAMPGLG